MSRVASVCPWMFCGGPHRARPCPISNARYLCSHPDPKPPRFDNHQQAYIHKNTPELLRALMVMNLCSVDRLVDNNKEMIGFGKAVLGQKSFDQLMKHTFYAQFVAGEDREEVLQAVKLLESFGVGAILDYAAESDIGSIVVPVKKPRYLETSPWMSGTVAPNLTARLEQARRDANWHLHMCAIDDPVRAEFHPNLSTLLNSVSMARQFQKQGFAAIKVTALIEPELLAKVSTIQRQLQKVFELHSCGTEPGQVLLRTMDLAGFASALHDLQVETITEDQNKELFLSLLSARSGSKTIDYLEWMSLFDMKTNPGAIFKSPLLSLSDVEYLEFQHLRKQLHHLCTFAYESNVKIMVDAEQTYLQPAISYLTADMQTLMNQQSPVVYNTFQCYLKETPDNVVISMEKCRREQIVFACKLVRGAYMEQERKLAQSQGYPDPIHPSYEETSLCYNNTLSYILDNISGGGGGGRASVMVASHNEESVSLAVKRMAELRLEPRGSGVFFGQLLGMCDAVTFTLSQHGYDAYKYVPYGPVKEVMPYLTRRAQENRSVMKGAVQERAMLIRELRRRANNGIACSLSSALSWLSGTSPKTT